jgi:hypothetical protein
MWETMRSMERELFIPGTIMSAKLRKGGVSEGRREREWVRTGWWVVGRCRRLDCGDEWQTERDGRRKR